MTLEELEAWVAEQVRMCKKEINLGVAYCAPEDELARLQGRQEGLQVVLAKIREEKE